MFPDVDKDKTFPQREVEILRFWKERDVYHKSLAARRDAPPYVFYEGPPTANGMPHPGHCLTRAIKDLFPRYRTMRGFRCERKAGWDTHGLPVETEVSKELGIHSKEEIQQFGVEAFIHRCQQSVWKYMAEWERLTERIGFWVDLKNAYVTYHQSYVESVWWSLANLFNRGLLYKGHKIVWWWAQGGTALSSGEVGQGYREVSDPSVFIKFPLIANEQHRKLGLPDNSSLLAWTTTPWTLPANQFAAVNPELDYAVVSDTAEGDGAVLIAAPLVAAIADKVKRPLNTVRTIRGAKLIGLRYQPPFTCYLSDHLARRIGSAPAPKGVDSTRRAETWMHQLLFESECPWLVEFRVVAGSFVTTDSGTGIVHVAPAFGEADFEVLAAEREDAQARVSAGEDVLMPTLLNPVAPDGRFTDDAPDYCRGRWVKDCDKDVIQDLKSRGRLYHREQYVHDYPFCWRAEEDPLIQYPRESWFIRTTAFKDAMLANNAEINWLPPHIKEGRFGKFLESNVDWALSRERFWGTPLPIWVCSETGKMEAVDSYDDLLAKPGVAGVEVWEAAKRSNPRLVDDLRVHKPYIDAVSYDSPFAPRGRMNRVSEVIDCWYDSGAMPFAQWGYRGPTNDHSDSLPLEGRAGEGGETGAVAAKGESSDGSSPLPNPPPQGEGTRRTSESAVKKFRSQFPADFISEAIDQTRGWFYSQLAISTMLWGKNDESEKSNQTNSVIRHSSFDNSSFPYPHPFRTCIVLGLMLGEDGQKMSKSKRNYREPSEIFDRYGADALRWYFFANQPPWTSIRYSEQAIKDSVPEFLLRLWNVYSFFTIYANIDGFDPAAEVLADAEAPAADTPLAGDVDAALLAAAESYRPVAARAELDRWVLSELHRTSLAVVQRMDDYDNFAACAEITAFVDALSNWYVRRSRDRFWSADKRSAEKVDAYWTLYECLVTTAKLIAPFTPFLAESLWQQLVAAPFGARAHESVHLADYPTGESPAVDRQLSERMNLVRHIASLGRQARTVAALKVRQPLARVEVILADVAHRDWLKEHAAVIEEELNVKQVEFSDEPDQYVHYEVLPNFKALGPRLGKLMPRIRPALAAQSGAELLANIRDNGRIDLEVDGQSVSLGPDEVEVRLHAKPGWTAANDKGVVVVLATELTPELVAEGLARDLVRAIQDRRKELGCEFTDRIHVGVVTESDGLRDAIGSFRDYIAAETLAEMVVADALSRVAPHAAKAGDVDLQLYIQVAT